MPTKKLIEVALPLEKINAEAAREKSIRFGHPSTLHLWWARRPLAAARAVIWASLVDDPSSHQELFPTEEEQNRERQRLFRILENLVVWENSNNEEVLSAAKAEIMKYTDGNPPALLDPFAGGGAIPLEAQRMGLEAHAHDLNPVAVMINKAMIEIPPRFANKPPVNPDAQGRLDYAEGWHRAQGLVEDVRYYGEWMKQEAFKRIGHLYPKVEIPQEQGGGHASVISWIWTRTVKCPNPACGCQMPLASNFVLSKKGKSLTYVQPIIDGKTIRYEIKSGNAPPQPPKSAHGVNFQCLFCGANATGSYIRKEAVNQRLDCDLMAIVAEGRNGRIFLSPRQFDTEVASSAHPRWKPDQLVTTPCHDVDRLPMYGMPTWGDAFTPRQLSALTTFCELVAVAQKKAESDAIAAGMLDDHIPLRKGGNGAMAYAEAVGVYLAFAINRMTNILNALCRWEPSRCQSLTLFSRQAIPMIWDYAENNPFSNAAGDFTVSLNNLLKALENFSANNSGCAEQYDAQTDCGIRNVMVSTDPPYYDNIGYADLSDFFYVWMRQSLKETYPELFSTMLVPKAEELTATPHRHNGSIEKAKSYFEDGMLSACKLMNLYAREDIPVTIYYAYKQSDADDSGVASSGWETMLGAIVNAGFSITGTWPMRTEMANRVIASGTNALASSIVLVCRKRPVDAPICPRRSLIAELRRELRPALQKLQRSNIAPVDLAQSAIGPGMAVFSKYSKVLEADGTPMSVRSALQIINQELDIYFNEQDVDLDRESRFCVDLYTQFAFNDIKFGDADTLARAKNTSVSAMASAGIVYAQKGFVHLLGRDEVPQDVQKNKNICWLLTQQLTHSVLTDGVQKCAKLVASILGSNAESAKDLAYRLFTIADRKGWTQEAYAYNALVTAWPEIQAQVAVLQAANGEQLTMFE